MGRVVQDVSEQDVANLLLDLSVANAELHSATEALEEAATAVEEIKEEIRRILGQDYDIW